MLADGRIVRADADSHPELYWAVRGAGANMGIVTSCDIEATELDDVIYARFLHDVKDLAGFRHAWRVKAA